MVWPFRERRQYERVKIDVPCRLHAGRFLLTGTTRDISLGGICFAVELDDDARASLDGSTGTASAILPEGTVESPCRVVRVEAEAVAVQFVDFKGTPGRKLLHAFLETQVSRISTRVPNGSGDDH